MYSTVLCKKFFSNSLIRDLNKSLNVIGVQSKSALGANFAKSFSHNGVRCPDKQPFLRPAPYTCTISNDRYYCKNYRPFPEVPEFPPVVWPNFFKSISGWLYSFLIIKPKFDNNFSLVDFANNSKKVLDTIRCLVFFTNFSNPVLLNCFCRLLK